MKDTVIMLLTSTLLGYLLGSVSPSALIARWKRSDLRSRNTGNLGATNTMLTFGLRWGLVVLILDMVKAILAVTVAVRLFPLAPAAGLVAGCAAVFGHVFPFYLGFRGGKGLAPFLGVMLAFDPLIFITLLLLGTVLALIVNYTAAMPMTVAPLFPVAVWVRTANISCLLAAMTVSLLVIVKHWGNLMKAARHEDRQVREYMAKHWFHLGEGDGKAAETEEKHR